MRQALRPLDERRYVGYKSDFAYAGSAVIPPVTGVTENVRYERVTLAKLLIGFSWLSLVDRGCDFMTSRFAASEDELVDHRLLLLEGA
jgi:hypothetical protein